MADNLKIYYGNPCFWTSRTFFTFLLNNFTTYISSRLGYVRNQSTPNLPLKRIVYIIRFIFEIRLGTSPCFYQKWRKKIKNDTNEFVIKLRLISLTTNNYKIIMNLATVKNDGIMIFKVLLYLTFGKNKALFQIYSCCETHVILVRDPFNWGFWRTLTEYIF